MEELTISNRMSGLNPSAIREILKVTTNSNVISFAAGNPAEETFPVSELKELAVELFQKHGFMALQYGLTEGYAPLIEQIRLRLREKYAIGRSMDKVMILSGGQQGLDLSAKCLLNEGDTVLCEAYSFIGALNTFRSYGARPVGIPMDEEGMDPDALELALRREKNVRLIYTIPTFQNPMGVTMSFARRKRIYELAVRYNVMILEDSPYFELRYSGSYVPAIKTLDETGHVIYVGSFSKVISPGLRVGFLCTRSDLVSKLVVAKQGADVQTPLLTQMLVSSYLERYDLDAHIEDCRALYKEKRDRMISRMEACFPDPATFTRPAGGLFLWCEIPENISGTAFCKAAGERGVVCVPGGTFHPSGDLKSPCFRLNYSMPSLKQIDQGIDILADCLSAILP
ncbi:MAG: PLP-dependent aminotransferase family protein [Oscillospiraceae bacterium]|nr:PLP-dependent aminotransferase family protein [Oscillospiraceae bacterium]